MIERRYYLVNDIGVFGEKIILSVLIGVELMILWLIFCMLFLFKLRNKEMYLIFIIFFFLEI